MHACRGERLTFCWRHGIRVAGGDAAASRFNYVTWCWAASEDADVVTQRPNSLAFVNRDVIKTPFRPYSQGHVSSTDNCNK